MPDTINSRDHASQALTPLRGTIEIRTNDAYRKNNVPLMFTTRFGLDYYVLPQYIASQATPATVRNTRY